MTDKAELRRAEGIAEGRLEKARLAKYLELEEAGVGGMERLHRIEEHVRPLREAYEQARLERLVAERDSRMLRRGTLQGVLLSLAVVFFFMTWYSINVMRREVESAASETDAVDANETIMTPPVRAAVFGGACVMSLVFAWRQGCIPPLGEE